MDQAVRKDLERECGVVVIAYYQKMARMCGNWATARNMRKLGFTAEQARRVILGA